MSNVKIMVRVDQGEAIRAGKGVWGPQPVMVDLESLTQDQRDELARAKYDERTGALDLPWFSGYPVLAEATPEGVGKVLDAMRAREAKEKAKEIESRAQDLANIEAWLAEAYTPPANPDHPFLRGFGSYQHGGKMDAYLETLRPGLAALVEAEYRRRLDALDSHDAAEKASCKAGHEARRMKEEQKEAARLAQISAWVAEHGTPSQKARFERDLLPEEEVIDGIRGLAFACLDDMPRYERLVSGDLSHESSCFEGDVHFVASDLGAVDEGTFETMEAIEGNLREAGLLESATVSPRMHEGCCRACETTVSRPSVMVEIKVGSFAFSREYGVE